MTSHKSRQSNSAKSQQFKRDKKRRPPLRPPTLIRSSRRTLKKLSSPTAFTTMKLARTASCNGTWWPPSHWGTSSNSRRSMWTFAIRTSIATWASRTSLALLCVAWTTRAWCWPMSSYNKMKISMRSWVKKTLMRGESTLILNLGLLTSGKIVSHGHISLKMAKVLNVWRLAHSGAAHTLISATWGCSVTLESRSTYFVRVLRLWPWLVMKVCWLLCTIAGLQCSASSAWELKS